jgi:2-polyprenyl-3-methyl-5-hydroxy-6-metoxy-1,4-benzoquinol methylase
MQCIYCQSHDLELINSFADLRTISSDAKPWRKGFVMARCRACLFPQAGVTSEWRASANEIYSAYATYFQTSDFDQTVFIEGATTLRGDLFVDSVLGICRTKLGAQVLDFGCGAGNLLRSFSSSRADFNLFGYDLDDRELQNLQTIKNFKKLFVGELNTSLKFDLISMSHTLEHITNPKETLRQIRGLLSSDGYLVIAVPDCSLDPFKLLIADHCSHFSVKTLGSFLMNAGFDVVEIKSRLETRECWAICRPAKFEHSKILSIDDTTWLPESVEWINLVRDHAKSFSNGGSFGVFGTSINAIWLFGELELDVDFFVDEDASRQHTRLFGRPVVSPEEVVEGSIVYLPFVPALASKIATRLNNVGISWVVPPDANMFGAN